ncbi:MAG: DUF934 domain-containing protein [Paracoccaceae bacterium]
MGFQGCLIAKSHVLADQYVIARRVGFDGVDISQYLANRQPEQQWLVRAQQSQNDYRARLS